MASNLSSNKQCGLQAKRIDARRRVPCGQIRRGALVGCSVGAAGAAAAAAEVPGRLVLVLASLFEAAVPGLEVAPRGGRAPFTGGVPGLLPEEVPGLEA